MPLRATGPRDGKFVRVPDVERGRPFLYSAEEWSSRARESSDKIVGIWIWFYPPAMFLTVLVVSLALGTVEPFWIMYALIYSVLYLVVFGLSEIYHRNREVRRGNYTGLFEMGVQYRVPYNSLHFFIPYHLIEGFKVNTKWPFPNLELRIRGRRRPLKLVHAPEILGSEGLALMDRMVRGEPGPTEPPRLVLYTEGGTSRVEDDPTAPYFGVGSQL